MLEACDGQENIVMLHQAPCPGSQSVLLQSAPDASGGEAERRVGIVSSRRGTVGGSSHDLLECDIRPEQIEICKGPDGNELLLGCGCGGAVSR